MKCRIRITAVSDIAAWVTRDAFMSHVDPDDLACRESEEVLDWYNQDWFSHDKNGELYFTPPAFEFRNGHLLGINGRHRAVLLYRHLDVIPMLLVLPGTWPHDKLIEIMEREIGKNEIVELPDLPIKTKKEAGDPVAEGNA
jgi:hypothetical protein